MVEGIEPVDVRVVRCGGSRINYRRPVFSADSRYLLCASGDLVKVYSTATEECVHALKGHKNLVTGIQLNPKNHLQLYSTSLDGTIKLWDFTDGILIKTFVVDFQLLALYASAADEKSIFAIIPKDNKVTGKLQLMSISLPKSTAQEVEAKDLTLILDDVCQSPKSIAFGREGVYVASVKALELRVFFFKKKKHYSFPLGIKNRKGANAFTCVACHPKEDCIATGHKDGKIRLWRNFNHKQEYTYSSQHWHHDAVNDLVFSAEGTNLLSGGVESVLVQWRYGSETTKDFLPRLGGAIEHIAASPDGVLHCTSHSDNKITIVQSNLDVSAVIQGLVQGQEIITGLMLDPRSKALVLNGKPGHLQFYSLQSDKQLYNLDIVQQEYIHQSGLKQTEVVKAVFDSQGAWLVTVEERKGEETDLELQMKLWAYNEKTQSFVLNTTINAPHESRISALCFQNVPRCRSGPATLVTTGLDCQFKVWILGDDSDIYRTSVSWSCDFVGKYHHLQATNCSFSEDGSLLAVSFEQIITLWDPDTWDLKCTFCHPPGKIRDLAFGRLSCSKYLLGTTDNGFLCCWNLLSCILEWSTQLNVKVLQVDPLSENVAAFTEFTRTTDLFVFKPNEPRPLYMQTNVCSGRVQWALFVPREVPEDYHSDNNQWLVRSQLYFLSASQSLMTFGTESVEERLTPSSKQLVIEENIPKTPFHVLLGKHREQQTNFGSETEQTALPEGSATINQMLHTPAHVLPNASFLCLMFVNSLLIPKMGISTKEEHEDLEMESENEKDEDDSDVEMNPIENEQEMKKAFSSEEQLPKLTKSEEKELKKLRKVSYSWLTAV
ncbi:WD repeat-containing protein 75 [Scyliorhinus canicula]|uniref:WD repeat-containing protein 75 n=1 Tax=Scyliorhinus canicula TaxID=7830 RepID=UPI0018F72131|nr:WD repeat-containing protein 75 [Scyliorhinus canicula]